MSAAVDPRIWLWPVADLRAAAHVVEQEMIKLRDGEPITELTAAWVVLQATLAYATLQENEQHAT